jgi:hypothetical protein
MRAGVEMGDGRLGGRWRINHQPSTISHHRFGEASDRNKADRKMKMFVSAVFFLSAALSAR